MVRLLPRGTNPKSADNGRKAAESKNEQGAEMPYGVTYTDLGRMPYGESLELQKRLFGELLRAKEEGHLTDGHLLLVEHPAVYTIGKSGRESNLLVAEDYLKSLGAEYWHTDRGGDITFHGEGQVVGYPIVDLERTGLSLKEYIAALEQSVIDTVALYGITAGRIEGASGVWVDEKSSRPRKICAIGVRTSRYVTMHGFALNATTDLRWFDYINPCGFTDRGVTSIAAETGKHPDMNSLKQHLTDALSANINVKIYKN